MEWLWSNYGFSMLDRSFHRWRCVNTPIFCCATDDLRARKKPNIFYNQVWWLLARIGKMYDIHGTISRLHDGLRV